MFRRSQRVRPPVSDEPTSEKARERFTYIHHDTTVTGDVKASGRVRLHGTVHGDVEVAGLLEVAKDGVVDGASIVAEALVVLGHVRGSVRVSGKVEVWKGGVLEGDVRAGSLDIEDGATFVGRSEMALPDGPPQLGAPTAEATAEATPEAIAGSTTDPTTDPTPEATGHAGGGTTAKESAEAAADAPADGATSADAETRQGSA